MQLWITLYAACRSSDYHFPTSSMTKKSTDFRIIPCWRARAARPKGNTARWLATGQMHCTIEHEKRSVWEGAKYVFPTGFNATRPLKPSIFTNSFNFFCFAVCSKTWVLKCCSSFSRFNPRYFLLGCNKTHQKTFKQILINFISWPS